MNAKHKLHLLSVYGSSVLQNVNTRNMVTVAALEKYCQTFSY